MTAYTVLLLKFTQKYTSQHFFSVEAEVLHVCVCHRYSLPVLNPPPPPAEPTFPFYLERQVGRGRGGLAGHAAAQLPPPYA